MRHDPRALLHLALITATCFLLSSSLSAQSVDSVLARPMERHSLVRLAAEGARTTGRLMSLGGGTVTLDAESGRRVINLSSVDTVWVRGRATAKGAIIGGATALVFVVAAALIGNGLCEYDCPEVSAADVVIGTLEVAGFGAIVGGGIGALIPKWKRRYP